ncbi:MAG: hypothetical protein P4L41_00345 [Flavipsychrobacter sp.]|nr:hypothetical protein [Flavipsychrobacter sp.]
MGDHLQIKNGDLDLIMNGSVIVSANEITTFIIKDDGQPLNLLFKFENSESEPSKARMAIKLLSPDSMELIFTNYNSFTGHWRNAPLPVGVMYNRELFLLYHISGLINKELHSDFKKIEYSFYLGKSINSGKEVANG